ncbi:glycerol kinase GlpK [Massilimicrobiota sp. An80]|uniref:glycerol kinase GlpK n=1 Tax=Massilimicrobiota sp. An80 TaxID=1965658 RepID=UPI000B42CF7A|nr:glycerol kinase GlpK [Massilimicrobiota sp. An80]OUN37176.1 glycerol kinase [Massilimicrobiota sp. An80]
MEEYILAIDQGTTSTRAILFDQHGHLCHMQQREFKQYFPHPGWVEHDAKEIWNSVVEVVQALFTIDNIQSSQIKAIGITNQRETTVVWDKTTGEPVYHAIVWQSRQSQDICDELIEKGYSPMIQEKTGLIINPYFSASKIKWILDHIDYEHKDQLLFGTIDTWLIWKLTGGKVHATDYTNASRTMLYNIHDLKWEDDLLALFDIPRSMLPEVKESSCIYGYSDETQMSGLHFRAPICGVAGDQQASLFGHTCFQSGDIKNTYGTGCFILMNTGHMPVTSNNGLLTTIAWGLHGEITYALEGSVFIGGSVMQWLRDGLHLIQNVGETEAMAQSLKNNEGVYLIPAFVGLGTPYWENDVRGTIFGLTRGTSRNHIVRAALESIAFQSCDVIEVMKQEAHISLKSLSVDGGATSNAFLMQFQSDMLHIDILQPQVKETTALGAAYLAGLAIGFYKSQDDIKKNHHFAQVYHPVMNQQEALQYYKQWQKAIAATCVFK